CTCVTRLRLSCHPSSSSLREKAATQSRDHAVSAAPTSTTTRRTGLGCALAASGHTVALATSEMNSRRLMGLSKPTDHGLGIAGLAWISGSASQHKAAPFV